MERFDDRAQAGRLLAAQLEHLATPDVVVLGVPRGGVPVAVQVAHALALPLDVIVVRKLGLPSRPELAMGAVGEGGARVLNSEVLRSAGVTEAALAAVESREVRELQQRCAVFRAGRPAISLVGRAALVVDDGIATGSTMRAACRIARAHGARLVVAAAPVASREAVTLLRQEADDVVVLATPSPFLSVGEWYRDFSPVLDSEVTTALRLAAPREARRHDVLVPMTSGALPASLAVPAHVQGVVVFAHGSGSSRFSPRNGFVARRLHQAGFATLLVDLLAPAEERVRQNVFDIELLARRLHDVCLWLQREPATAGLPLGLFGASTGAAAALVAAADPSLRVGAVVSRGGRVDLAQHELARVVAPTLLVVGGHDDVVLGLNRQAQQSLRCPHRLVVIPGASHLFEEPGAMSEVAAAACAWFSTHLAPSVSPVTVNH
ncbi:MAG TPA: phosphoribosyltransferase family protein [Actinomycetales bacterium]|nr:phosphoribosyltransferase family protein [Actinomycetales bacterium]